MTSIEGTGGSGGTAPESPKKLEYVRLKGKRFIPETKGGKFTGTESKATEYIIKVIEQIKNINQGIGWKNYSRHLMPKRWDQKKPPVYIAKEGDDIVGFVILEKKDGKGYIPYVAVKKDRQGQETKTNKHI